jgi:hypothetical protein
MNLPSFLIRTADSLDPEKSADKEGIDQTARFFLGRPRRTSLGCGNDKGRFDLTGPVTIPSSTMFASTHWSTDWFTSCRYSL